MTTDLLPVSPLFPKPPTEAEMMIIFHGVDIQPLHRDVKSREEDSIKHKGASRELADAWGC